MSKILFALIYPVFCVLGGDKLILELNATSQSRETTFNPRTKAVNVSSQMRYTMTRSVNPISSTEKLPGIPTVPEKRKLSPLSNNVPQQVEYYYLLPSHSAEKLYMRLVGSLGELKGINRPYRSGSQLWRVGAICAKSSESCVMPHQTMRLMNHLVYHKRDDPAATQHTAKLEKRAAPAKRRRESRPIQVRGEKYVQYTSTRGDGNYDTEFLKGNKIHNIASHSRTVNMKNHSLFQQRVKWADKNGGYGEHYWDLGHA